MMTPEAVAQACLEPETAQKYVDAALSVIQASKQTKMPALDTWKEYQQRFATPDEMKTWYHRVYANTAIAVICGKISGNLEILDFDLQAEKVEAWRERVEEQAPGLVGKLCISRTQSGGKHVKYRCPDATIPGNSKLAQRLVDGKPKALIETRGEGGYFLSAPTNGYQVIQGDILNLPVITPQERQALWAAALALDEYLDPQKIEGMGRRIPKEARRPGDDFNERGNVAAILEKHGWQPQGSRGIYQHYRRPGKDRGSSASLIEGRFFYNFSANGHPFEMGAAYSPFAVYALLEHGGDYEKAAKELSKEGYGEEGEKEKKSQATLLIELALSAGAELWHTPNGEFFATIPTGGHTENWPIKSKGFRSWLAGLFYAQTEKAPNAQGMQDALNTLEAMAQFQGKKHEAHIRVAHHEGRIYIDLGNDDWEVVGIAATGWRVIKEAPVKFRRPRGMALLPLPMPGGGLEELRQFINVRSEDDWRNIIGWIIGALSRGPYPIIALQGVQGSAKTTLSRILKTLLDPGNAPVRATPREVRDLMIAATNGHVLAFDNLSLVKDWLSDCFCRLATGGGFSTRELYTDGEEKIFDAMRPLILNGIGGLIHRQDLADRTIIIELPSIPENKRMPETEFWQKFEAAQPKVLGGICDALSAALKNQTGVRLAGLPRMADFAIWVTAAELALGWEPGSFLKAYRKNRAAVIDQSLEADPVAVAIKDLMADRELWEGSPALLKDTLEGLTPESTVKSKYWPKSATWLSIRLTQAAAFLQTQGIIIESSKSGDRK